MGYNNPHSDTYFIGDIMRIIKLIKKLICAYKGHDLNDDEEFICYVRDGRRFKHNGRLFRCKRCRALIYIKGIRYKELANLIRITLADLPKIELDFLDYDHRAINKILGINKRGEIK